VIGPTRPSSTLPLATCHSRTGPHLPASLPSSPPGRASKYPCSAGYTAVHLLLGVGGYICCSGYSWTTVTPVNQLLSTRLDLPRPIHQQKGNYQQTLIKESYRERWDHHCLGETLVQQDTGIRVQPIISSNKYKERPRHPSGLSKYPHPILVLTSTDPSRTPQASFIRFLSPRAISSHRVIATATATPNSPSRTTQDPLIAHHVHAHSIPLHLRPCPRANRPMRGARSHGILPVWQSPDHRHLQRWSLR
jgi:hypothetical protein